MIETRRQLRTTNTTRTTTTTTETTSVHTLLMRQTQRTEWEWVNIEEFYKIQAAAMAWNMGMKRNKTKTEKLTQPVRSVHKAQRCRCLCLCCRLCRRAQTKNAAASSEVERAKSSWVSHTSTACLMRNKWQWNISVWIYTNIRTCSYIYTVHMHDTYIQADLQMYGTYCT